MQKWNVICVMLKRTTDSGDWREAVTWVSFRAWQTHTVSGESTWSKQQSTASDRATDTEGDTQTNKPDMQIKTHHKLFSSCGPERFPPPPSLLYSPVVSINATEWCHFIIPHRSRIPMGRPIGRQNEDGEGQADGVPGESDLRHDQQSDQTAGCWCCLWVCQQQVRKETSSEWWRKRWKSLTRAASNQYFHYRLICHICWGLIDSFVQPAVQRLFVYQK